MASQTVLRKGEKDVEVIGEGWSAGALALLKEDKGKPVVLVIDPASKAWDLVPVGELRWIEEGK